MSSTKSKTQLDDAEIKEKINSVREKLEKELFCDELLYDAEDVNRLRNCDFEVRRYLLLTNMDHDQTVSMIKDRLIWRKEIGFSTMKANSFPREFYECGSVFEFKTDLASDPVIYVRSKFNIKSATFSKVIRHFLLYNMDLIDRKQSRERSWGLVFDAQGFGWSNIDIDFLLLIIKVLRLYMPWSVKYIIVYEIPRLMESIWKGIQPLIPEDGKKFVKVCNRKSICDFIDPENMPAVVGGLCKEQFVQIPDGCKSAQDAGYEGDDLVKVQKQFQRIMLSDKKLMI